LDRRRSEDDWAHTVIVRAVAKCLSPIPPKKSTAASQSDKTVDDLKHATAVLLPEELFIRQHLTVHSASSPPLASALHIPARP
jgi:hypothetical protein